MYLPVLRPINTVAGTHCAGRQSVCTAASTGTGYVPPSCTASQSHSVGHPLSQPTTESTSRSNAVEVVLALACVPSTTNAPSNIESDCSSSTSSTAIAGCCRLAAMRAVGSKVGSGSARLSLAMQPQTHLATCIGHPDDGGTEGVGEGMAAAAASGCNVAAITCCMDCSLAPTRAMLPSGSAAEAVEKTSSSLMKEREKEEGAGRQIRDCELSL